jgi:hypothetical protein
MRERNPRSLSSILETIRAASVDEGDVDVQSLVEAFGPRAFGPLLVAPAALIISPVGAIPGVPAFLSAFIVLICAQHVLGRSSPWLPRPLRERSISGEKLSGAIERVLPHARRVDALLKPRLRFLTRPPADRLLASVAAILAASIVAVGFVPLAAAIPSTGIALIGLSVATKDGLLALPSLASIAGTVWFAVSMAG